MKFSLSHLSINYSVFNPKTNILPLIEIKFSYLFLSILSPKIIYPVNTFTAADKLWDNQSIPLISWSISARWQCWRIFIVKTMLYNIWKHTFRLQKCRIWYLPVIWVCHTYKNLSEPTLILTVHKVTAQLNTPNELLVNNWCNKTHQTRLYKITQETPTDTSILSILQGILFQENII